MTDKPSDKPKKKSKPVAYQAVIIENFKDGTFKVRMEAGRFEAGQYVPEIRKQGSETRCDAQQAAALVGQASGRIQAALLESATGENGA